MSRHEETLVGVGFILSRNGQFAAIDRTREHGSGAAVTNPVQTCLLLIDFGLARLFAYLRYLSVPWSQMNYEISLWPTNLVGFFCPVRRRSLISIPLGSSLSVLSIPFFTIILHNHATDLFIHLRIRSKRCNAGRSKYSEMNPTRS